MSEMANRKQYMRPSGHGEARKKPAEGHKGPLLSIGVIFKNEIRCLERCLNSLQPLRDAIPCQLVMADTGSDDGSREIAARYADVLFDFPWMNDFAAARNAVLERCKGAWALTVDCDEWLDDPAELIAFLRHPNPAAMMASVIIRNYKSADAQGLYLDFKTVRMFRMREHPRYQGAIHEYIRFTISPPYPLQALRNTVFHHDGYVDLDSEPGKLKRKRNLELLRKELQQNPDGLRLILQYLESGYDAPDYLETLKRGVAAVERKTDDNWRLVGPAIFSLAAQYALHYHMTEWEALVRRAEELFPESYHVRLDINAMRCFHDCDRQAYQESAQAGEAYMKALAEFDTDERAETEQQVTAFAYQGELQKQSVRSALSCDYLALGRIRDALDMFKSINMDMAREEILPFLLQTLAGLYRVTDEDFTPYITALWDGAQRVSTAAESVEKRVNAILTTAKKIFQEDSRRQQDGEDQDSAFERSACALFLPLAGECPAGDWAKIMTLDDPDALSDLLSRLDVSDMPAPVLLHALSHGAEFPLPDRPMTPEEVGTLCESLRTEKDALIPLALDAANADYAADWQSLLWTESLMYAALSVCDWSVGERRYELFRVFSATEKTFISRYYAPQAVENLRVLPLRHRTGWRCAQAMDALDNGDFVACVARLRDALQEDRRMTEAVNFMLDTVSRMEREAHTPPELLEMAGQMREMLAALNPDAPEVRQLKESPAYQQLAWLIEE